jgi:hypothetical protein
MLALIAWLAIAAPAQDAVRPITLIVRVYDGARDVGDDAVVRIYSSGDRRAPVGESHDPITVLPG